MATTGIKWKPIGLCCNKSCFTNRWRNLAVNRLGHTSQAYHQFGEFLHVQTLATIADGVVRVGMDFKDKGVSSCGDGGTAHRRDIFTIAGAVGWIGDDW